MKRHSINPVELVHSLWRNRDLIRTSVKRDILARYRGSLFGILWSFFNPLFMLVVYTLVFSEVFKARWQPGSESKTEYALVLFAGLIVFNMFAACIGRSPDLITSNVNYVKRVVFPLEILPVVATISAIFDVMTSLGVWLLAYAVFFGMPHVTVLYIPFVLAPFALMMVGASWLLAALGAYLRDISQFMGLVTSTFLFLSPIFYPVTALPQSYRFLMAMNPLSGIIEQARRVLYFGDPPEFLVMGGYWLAAFVIAWLGYAWFQKTRKGFADVL